MKIHLLVVAAVVGCFASASAQVQGTKAAGSVNPPSASGSGAIPDRYIVQVKAGHEPGAVAAGHGVAARFVYRAVANGFAGSIPPGKLRALERDPRVAAVVPDRVMVAIAKPGKGKGGGSSAPPPEIIPAGVQRIGASPGALPYAGAGVGVAIVDTGIDFAHGDLTPIGALSFSAYGTSAQDDEGHGTHVTGIVCARVNAIDVVGVAPAATPYAVKVLDQAGRGSDSTIIAGLDWIGAHAGALSPPIRVVNMSLGRRGELDDNPLLRESVQNLTASGICVVVAAGNDPQVEVREQVPATYPEVLAIASTTAADGTNKYRFFKGFIAADTASYFTTDGAWDPEAGIGVTISAPGAEKEDITKAGFIQSVGIPSTKLGGGTTQLSGTSMAAPHVAGVVALMWQQALEKGETLHPEDIRTRIMQSAQRMDEAPLNSPTSSYSFDGEREGILSAPGALFP